LLIVLEQCACFSVQALERRTMWQWLCAPHAQVSRNILMSGGQLTTRGKVRTIKEATDARGCHQHHMEE